jgi:DNA-binding CsgD family transcriptional regulator
VIAQGLSNKEIARRVFDKLGARRRTEAVQMGKASGLIP